MQDTTKEFRPSSWAIDNRVAIFVFTIILLVAGIISYNKIPKESFPDISLPNIYVSVIYAGTSPTDMENLIVRPIEKECKSIAGVKKIKSNSMQDYANVIVEFNSEENITEAKRKVKDAVDRARKDLPADLSEDPVIEEINFADLPIMYVNISGPYELARLKKFADEAKDKIESLPEVKKVDVIGELVRQIQINVDMFKMQASGVTMGDIEQAVKYENLTVPGGSIAMDGVRRTMSVSGDFKNVDEIRNLVIKSMEGKTVYLKEIADVEDSFKEQESYSRLDHNNVITLAVVKRLGANLIEASDHIVELMDKLQQENFPDDLKVVLTNDQSEQTRTTLHDLINTIVIGFLLVVILLMFFMGPVNAFFVALSVPLSMCVAFIIMPTIGFTMNFIVLYSFLLALGIVVDDAIVVIENTHRIFANGRLPVTIAAKRAAGEVFMPVFSGTLTTLAPFIPLAFWTGIIGKFMFFLPITLIITLMASLFVAYIINPAFAVQFMKPHKLEYNPKKGLKIMLIIFGGVIAISYATGLTGLANFAVLIMLLNLLHRFWLYKIINRFREKIWPSFQNFYARILKSALSRPYTMLIATVCLFFLSIGMLIVRNGGVRFFPEADPNFIFVYTSLPVGTDQAYTDSITQIVEKRVYNVIGEHNPLVKSVISNVGVAVTDPVDEDQGYYANKSKVTVAFVKFSERKGQSTRVYLDRIRQEIKGIPGAEITVAQEQSGPPVGKPISIEITGDDFDLLNTYSSSLKRYLDSLQIPGVEELKSDLQANKPQITFKIDRERVNRESIFTGQIGNEINLAVLGRDISKYREDNDEYDIVLKFKDEQRNNIDLVTNLKIMYRDMAAGGMVRNVPLSTFADIQYTDTYATIKRKNQKRIVTIASNVLSGYNEQGVVASVVSAVKSFPVAPGVEVKMGGAQQEQAETMAFLFTALLVSFLLIIIILVVQFNSVGKPLIIMVEIMFSIIGSFLGFSIFKMEFSTVMSGIGIIALAGIVVRNGILIVEFTDLLRQQGVPLMDAIVEAGRIRMTPVVLTAAATMLGLVPLAIGFNIDFVTLFTELKPDIYFGGDSTAFWGPLSWTMIFGLGFATFLTLILVPVMYLLGYRVVNKTRQWTARLATD
ncbi:MAG: efflux RND transporter permease subunit [Bacteroidia bacterium]|nr:efflux RND transporter permease subunit [Bacteroidia bacterium]MCZ2277715.1 efflux RND transporter permease subunit [Bacteroidia bacterium]